MFKKIAKGEIGGRLITIGLTPKNKKEGNYV
jgi:hypothetical protein